ncbi:MAG: endonuclease Q family protein [Candidatus Woesearchaeota archaeon]
MLFADFHIQSYVTNGSSKDMTVENIEKTARIKGLHIVGTGGFTHPEWYKELTRNLIEENGLYKTASGLYFILQTEVNLVFMHNGRERKVHIILLAPSFETVEEINRCLAKYGDLTRDGCPTLSLSCTELTRQIKEISEDIEIIPAHIFDESYGVLGYKNGFRSLSDAFGKELQHIYALEIGIECDPTLAWRISSLDQFTLLANSDARSPHTWQIGKNANILAIPEIIYRNIIDALRTQKNFYGTIEYDPQLSSSYADGHRRCNFSSLPAQTKELNGICPICKKPLVTGILHHIERLADRPIAFERQSALPFKTIIPLAKLIAWHYDTSPQSKKVQQLYDALISAGKDEFTVLLYMSSDILRKYCGEELTEIIIRNRYGQVRCTPGFDGASGYPDFGKPPKITEEPSTAKSLQTSLTNF